MLFSILGVLLYGAFIWIWIKGRKSRNWPSVTGRVVESWVDIHEYEDEHGFPKKSFSAKINYQYAVDGIEYSGDRRTFSSVQSGYIKRVEEIVARYPSGAVVQVYYHPDDPKQSVLEPGSSWGCLVLLLLPLLAIFVVGVLYLLDVL